MMVLLVSECEKKALPRTRRVLDAFANRIGSNTWQTVITQDGLNALKKLLRKTATKSTAVTCHWIRGASRTELLWMVGNRNKFNAAGMVAVNWTEQELFMDVKPIKLEDHMVYANTHGQPLAEHLFSVAYVAQCLYERLFDQCKLSQPVFIAGAFKRGLERKKGK
jgi:CRISPR-associated endonuclease/helicase Cas3